MSSSLGIVGLLLSTACNNHPDRPRAAVVYPEHGEHRASIVAGDDDADSADEDPNAAAASCTPTTCAAQGLTCGTIDDGCGGTERCGTCADGLTCSDEKGGTCASDAECTSGAMRLLGSCEAYSDGKRFSSGAHCEDYYDRRAGATSTALEWKCACQSGVWSTQPCNERVASRECVIEGGASSCTRVTSCFPNDPPR